MKLDSVGHNRELKIIDQSFMFCVQEVNVLAHSTPIKEEIWEKR